MSMMSRREKRKILRISFVKLPIDLRTHLADLAIEEESEEEEAEEEDIAVILIGEKKSNDFGDIKKKRP